MLLGGERMLEPAPTSTPTAQLLTGGPIRRSPSDGGHHQQGDDPDTNVCYNFYSSQQEALQLYYVNAGFSHGLSSDGRATVMTTLMYPPQNPDHNSTVSDMHQPCEEQNEQQYRAPFLPFSFEDKAIHRRPLEGSGPAEADIPLGLGAHSESVTGSQSYSNWSSVGSEHSFLPMSKLSQNDNSQFGADLANYRVAHSSQHMSHMHQTDHFQNDPAGHTLQLDVHTHGLSMSNGQGLSLSLSSHQQQSTALQFRSVPGDVASADHFHTVAAALQSQEAAIAQSKALSSRYLTGSANSDLHMSRYHTPIPGEDFMGTGYQQHNLEVARGRNKMDSSQSSGYTGVPRPLASHHITTSRFLKTAQDVLNEVCRVSQLSRKRAPKRRPTSPEQQYNTAGAGSSATMDANFTKYSGRDDRAGAMVTEAADSANDPASTFPSLNAATHMAAMRQAMTESREELELKKGRLILMVDEVEARYRRYCDHLQLVITRFNTRAGPGGATPYTILALHAMSRHFRCLRDAIRHQLKVVKRALGEEECSRGGETTRLRYIDQQMRQQRTLGQQQQQQQLDLQMQQQNAWRPQRGLPERAVSVLRGWLFEHFLQPYPKDVDKLSLAKQTGLTRSQVSNWFINARVRLWKPMVEEMYLEEQKEPEEAEASGSMQEKANESDSGNNNFKQYEGANGY